MKARLFLTVAVLALGAAPALAQTVVPATAAAPAAKPHFGTWGVDLSAMDTTAKPGDDFQRYTSGKWLDATEIPADRPSVGAFNDLRETTQEQLQKLITEGPASTKYRAFYDSYMDEATVEKLGLAPLKADLAVLDAIATKRDFARFMGSTAGQFGIALVDSGPYADSADPTTNVLWKSQGGIGLPEREYYFADQFKTQRAAYVAYIERTMKAVGHANPRAAAKTIMAFETAIAEVSWKVADRRDIDKVNNPMSSAQLMSYAPGAFRTPLPK